MSADALGRPQQQVEVLVRPPGPGPERVERHRVGTRIAPSRDAVGRPRHLVGSHPDAALEAQRVGIATRFGGGGPHRRATPVRSRGRAVPVAEGATRRRAARRAPTAGPRCRTRSRSGRLRAAAARCRRRRPPPTCRCGRRSARSRAVAAAGSARPCAPHGRRIRSRAPGTRRRSTRFPRRGGSAPARAARAWRPASPPAQSGVAAARGHRSPARGCTRGRGRRTGREARGTGPDGRRRRSTPAASRTSAPSTWS